MTQTSQQLRDRFKMYCSEYAAIGLPIDLSRMNFSGHYFAAKQNRMQMAFAAMASLSAEIGSTVDFTSETSAAGLLSAFLRCFGVFNNVKAN